LVLTPINVSLGLGGKSLTSFSTCNTLGVFTS
jgi:hypothetical protein